MDLSQLIKKAAVEAVDASKPVGYVFGEVTSIDPLTIEIDRKLPLPGDVLILTRAVTEYTTTISSPTSTERITVHNALKIGEKVILARMQSGQRYIVLDRVGVF